MWNNQTGKKYFFLGLILELLIAQENGGVVSSDLIEPITIGTFFQSHKKLKRPSCIVLDEFNEFSGKRYILLTLALNLLRAGTAIVVVMGTEPIDPNLLMKIKKPSGYSGSRVDPDNCKPHFVVFKDLPLVSAETWELLFDVNHDHSQSDFKKLNGELYDLILYFRSQINPLFVTFLAEFIQNNHQMQYSSVAEGLSNLIDFVKKKVDGKKGNIFIDKIGFETQLNLLAKLYQSEKKDEKMIKNDFGKLCTFTSDLNYQWFNSCNVNQNFFFPVICGHPFEGTLTGFYLQRTVTVRHQTVQADHMSMSRGSHEP